MAERFNIMARAAQDVHYIRLNYDDECACALSALLSNRLKYEPAQANIIANLWIFMSTLSVD